MVSRITGLEEKEFTFGQTGQSGEASFPNDAFRLCMAVYVGTFFGNEIPQER